MPAALTDAPPREIVIDGEAVGVRVRVSAKARTIRVRVGPDRPPEIIVPRGTSEARIDAVLADRRDWMAAKLGRVRSAADRPPALGLDRPGVVWLDLQPVPVRVNEGAPDGARLGGDALVVGGPAGSAPDAVARWYRREARRTIIGIVEQEAQRLGVDYRSVSVRDQRTRWGSCSAAGNLSFNWRLVVAPEDVRRYVITHELCHVRIANHNKEFWRLVDAAMPGWHAPAAWLREHGRELRAYQPRRSSPLHLTRRGLD